LDYLLFSEVYCGRVYWWRREPKIMHYAPMRNHSIQKFCKYDLVGQAKNLTSYIDIRPHQLLPN